MTSAVRSIHGRGHTSATRHTSPAGHASVTPSNTAANDADAALRTDRPIVELPENARATLASLASLVVSDRTSFALVLRAARALLDKDPPHHEEHDQHDAQKQNRDHDLEGREEDRSEYRQAISDLVESIVSNLTRDSGVTLSTVSLTAPVGHGAVLDDLRVVAHRATRKEANHGALLVVDRRPKDGTEHGYGVTTDDETLQRWTARVGAHSKGNRRITVSGWRQWTSNDPAGRAVLVRNLRRIVPYAVKVHGDLSELASHSVASGPFTDPWSRFVERFERASRIEGMPRAVTAACVVCGARLSTRRRDAETCSARCRKRRSRMSASPRSVTRGEQR